MSIEDEVVEALQHMIDWGDPYEVNIDACKKAIKLIRGESKEDFDLMKYNHRRLFKED